MDQWILSAVVQSWVDQLCLSELLYGILTLDTVTAQTV